MTLELPFVGSLVTLVYKISCTPLKDRPLREAGYSEELIDVVRKASAKDAELRPTAKSLLEDEAFWKCCTLDASEELALHGCSENRLATLRGGVGSDGTGNMAEVIGSKCTDGNSFVGTESTAEIAVLDSWSSNELTGTLPQSMIASPQHSERARESISSQPLLGSLNSPSIASSGDFYKEEDFVTRSTNASPCNSTAVNGGISTHIFEDTTLATSADELLRRELHAAHAAGTALSPQYLADLLKAWRFRLDLRRVRL
mmetsp:Transcript_36720/g.58397  ORF Transcript_36720/g.58397 Transcript_36720/m.58397 type:complete len:258 (+) Transcript_36720:1-774(+)